MEWNHVSKFHRKELAAQSEFLYAIALAAIPRRHSKFPFCHPGHVVNTVSGTKDWFYADSIVVNPSGMHYVVRWVGYEDE